MNTKVVKNLSFNKKVDNKDHSKGFLSRLGSPFTTQSEPSTPVGSPPHAHDSSSSINSKLSEETSVESSILKEKQLFEDAGQCAIALDHFLNSNINEAEAILKPHYKDSMYYSLGYSFILYLKSVMTFQEDDIKTTLESLKHTIRLASSSRKRESGWLVSVTSWMKGTTLENVKNMTVVERHAELVHAEAYLLKALLSIIHDESVMSFLRESLNIRSSYNAYMTLEKYVKHVYETDKDHSTLDNDFTSGVALGVGCFSLILSMLPASVVKVAELIGFSSDRAHGLKVLESVGGWNKHSDGTVFREKDVNTGLRSQMCNMVLIVYHIVLSKMVPLSDVDIPFAETILNSCLDKYPSGVFFLYFNGRLMGSKRLLKQAEEQYQHAIDTQKDWKQLQHMCFWELGLIYIMEQNWQKAYDIYTILQRDSNWSKAVYTYLKAVTLYKLANTTEDDATRVDFMKQVVSYMNQVTGEKQKIAGKSIPMEKFVARKARKFLSQKNYLLLLDLEVLNAFTAYDFMPVDVLQSGLNRINTEIIRLTANEKHGTCYYDDICLAEYLRAITARMLFQQGSDTETMHQIHEKSLNVVFDNADKIELDHYIYYFSRYEKANMLILDKEYAKAESEIQFVLKANDRGQYSIGSGPHAKNKYSLASALVFKCHNCITKIKVESSAN
ncbi:hypothetical protein [Parasitella parasitica]|uniref:Tetratricopeptide repeat protein 39B n=1 Tax=Parasitella parasitica TaxID=35722 RepID=A0A0B7NFI6_9FUNG|nr:hypothetical protein [Parasitella parasitica]